MSAVVKQSEPPVVDVPVQRGLACCPNCKRWLRFTQETGCLAVYFSCQHYLSAWSSHGQLHAIFGAINDEKNKSRYASSENRTR